MQVPRPASNIVSHWIWTGPRELHLANTFSIPAQGSQNRLEDAEREALWLHGHPPTPVLGWEPRFTRLLLLDCSWSQTLGSLLKLLATVPEPVNR